jgi:GT2 family glycosyltransferase
MNSTNPSPENTFMPATASAEEEKWIVGVVVIHHHDPTVTRQCLETLARQKGVLIALRLVDNSLAWDAPEPVHSDGFHSVEIIRCENHGFSHANNLGLADLRGTCCEPENFIGVLLLNNDAFPDPDSLYLLAQTVMGANPGAHKGPAVSVIAGATLYHSDRSLQSSGTSWHLRRGYGNPLVRASGYHGIVHAPGESLTTIDYPAGAALMLNHTALKALDWSMDPAYFLYFEELDLLCRLRAQGPLIVFPATAAKCIHLEGVSAGTGHHHHDRTAWSEYHFHRSKKLFYRKHFPSLLPRMWLLHWGVLWKRLSRMEWSRAVSVWKGYFWS